MEFIEILNEVNRAKLNYYKVEKIGNNSIFWFHNNLTQIESVLIFLHLEQAFKVIFEPWINENGNINYCMFVEDENIVFNFGSN